MALKFFADHCVPNSVMEVLREGGHDVLRVKDKIPTDSPDPVVIAKAQELDAILVSLNGDFTNIVAYPPNRYKGIVALQVRSSRGFTGDDVEIQRASRRTRHNG